MGTKSGKEFASQYLGERDVRLARKAAERTVEPDLNSACETVERALASADAQTRTAWNVILETLASEF